MMTHEFDQFSDGYEATVEQSVSFSGLKHDFFLAAKSRLLAKLFAERFADPHAISILDLGCGVGLFHPWLQPLVGRITGADPSGESIERARVANPTVTYAVEDGRAMSFADDSFDVALAVTALHHVPPADWTGFVAEMRRVVRPGGLVVIIEHNPWNPLTRLAVARCELDRDAVLLSAGRATTLLKQAGCRKLADRHFLLLPSESGIARKLESCAASLPLGAQYLAFGEA
jgi:SAM-dependent methyltransferase